MAPVKALLLCYLAVVHQFVVTLAAPLEERGGSVCSSGIYGELAPILEQYSIAEEFCSVVYPVSCTASSTSPTKNKRAVSSTTSTSKAPTTTSTSKATSSSQTTSAADSKASAWSKCQQQPWNIISTLCSCIETPTPCKTTAASSTSTTTKASSTTTTTTKASSTTSMTASTTTSSSTTASTTSSASTTTSTTTSSSTTTSTTTSPSTTASTTTSSSTTTSTTTSSSTTTSTTTSCTYLPAATPTGGGTPYTFLDMTTNMFDATYIGQFYRGTSNTFFDISTPPCQAIQLCANAAYTYSQNPISFRLYQDEKATNDRWECDISAFTYTANAVTNVPDNNVGLQFHYSM